MGKLNIVDITFVKTKSEKVKIRADVQFNGFQLKGFKIVHNAETGKEFVTPPSYLSPKGWRPLFRTDNPQDWEEIQKEILKQFNHYEIKESVEETLGNYED